MLLRTPDTLVRSKAQASVSVFPREQIGLCLRTQIFWPRGSNPIFKENPEI